MFPSAAYYPYSQSPYYSVTIISSIYSIYSILQIRYSRKPPPPHTQTHTLCNQMFSSGNTLQIEIKQADRQVRQTDSVFLTQYIKNRFFFANRYLTHPLVCTLILLNLLTFIPLIAEVNY